MRDPNSTYPNDFMENNEQTTVTTEIAPTKNHVHFIPGKPRQVKALAMKAISAQKRAAFTNICCIVLCPLLMVAFASILGNVILNLIQRSNPITGIYIFD